MWRQRVVTVAVLASLLMVTSCSGGRGEKLVIAALDGDSKTVGQLLDQGVGIESEAMDGLTPLKAAAKNGKLAVVKLLVERGASINGGSSNDDTPLALAAIYNRTDVAEFLLSRGGKVRGTDVSNADLLKSLKEKGNQPLFDLIAQEIQREHAS